MHVISTKHDISMIVKKLLNITEVDFSINIAIYQVCCKLP